MPKYGWNLLRKYEQKFAELLEQEKLTVSRRILRKDDSSLHPDDDALDDLKGSRREYTVPRSDESSHVRRWIRGNTKIGPVQVLKVCYHQGRYGVEIMIESLFRDWTVSWARIVNGINKYATERQKKFLLQSLRTEVQGNLSWRLNHDRHRL